MEPDSDRQPFSPLDAEPRELARSAQFCVRLIDFLVETFDSPEGSWSEQRLVRRVANTCQLVEAFAAVPVGRITAEIVERAVGGLVDLNIPPHLSEDEARAVRLFPSRFKTLALLRRLNQGPRVLAELRELSDHLNASRGLMQDVSTEMRAELVTMIWLDTLLYMARDDWDLASVRAGRESARRTLARGFEQWLRGEPTAPANGSARRRLSLEQPGDASYAFDLLIRSGTITSDSPLARQARDRLLDALYARRRLDFRETDPIYTSIQLSTHFPDDTRVRAAVAEFIAEAREWFELNHLKEMPLTLPALVLRLLGVFYGASLVEQIHQDHWAFRRKTEQDRSAVLEQSENRELEEILRSTFQISIGGKQYLSGPRSINKVLRVKFGYKTAATDEEGVPARRSNQELRLIIKKGSVESLNHAVASYSQLPRHLQKYFARHTTADQVGYLLMQDLAQMQQLSEILDARDRTPLQVQDRTALGAAADAVCEAFQALHRDQQRVTGMTNHVERLYILPLTESVDFICEAHFPQLRPFVEEGFIANEIPYKRLITFITALKGVEAKLLRPPFLSKIHGDAHTRNVMVDAELQNAKFIDVESLADHQDYLADYALLLEDIAFYRLLPTGEPRRLLQPRDFTSTLAGEQSGEKQNTINYPAFPVRSDAALFMEHALLTRLRDFAATQNDESWQARLWLAIAKSLLMLVQRQTRSGRLKTMAPREALNLVLVAYAEAVRLLDELVNSLEPKRAQPLPELPFTGKRVAAREPDSRAIVQQVNQLFQELPGVRRGSAPDAPAWIRYYVQNAREPFAEFRTSVKQGDMALILFAPCQQLNDQQRLITTLTDDQRGVVIPKAGLTKMPALNELIRAAYQWAAAHGC